MTSGKWFSSWLWVSATLIIIHILWTCQQHLPSFSESTKIKFTSLSLSTHRWLICSGVLIVFSSLYLQSLRTYLKIITKAANPDFQIRKYSLIYELYKLGVTDKASSFITGNSSPACFSLPVHGSKTPFQMRLQQHSLINLGSWAADTGPWPPETSQWAPMPSCIDWRDVLLNAKLQPELLLVKFHSRQTPGFTLLIGPVQTFVYLLRIIFQMLEDIRVYIDTNPKWKM